MDKKTLISLLALTAVLFFVNQWFSSPKPAAQKEAVQPAPIVPLEAPSVPKELSTDTESGEKLYVLENSYQQLVFSNFGGSLAEINLPFKSESNTKSVVLPVGFDRTLQKEYPYTDHFPTKPYYIASDNGSAQFVKEPPVGGFYPLLRRSLYSATGKLLHEVKPSFYALSLKGAYEDLEHTVYKLRRFTSTLIEFEAATHSGKIIKTYSFPENVDAAPYTFNLSIRTEGDVKGLMLTSGVPDVEIVSGSSTPTLKYLIRKSNKQAVEQMKLPKTSTDLSSIAPEWISNSNGFLGIIINPLDAQTAGLNATLISGETLPTRLSVIDAVNELYPASKYPGYELTLPVRPQGQMANYRIYAGPYEDVLLKQVDKTYTKEGVSPKYSLAMSFHGWFTFISEPFAQFLFVLMNFFHFVTRSWGFSIILLTVALRAMLYPLNAWSIKATSKMQKVAPEIQKIQERFKKDPKRAQMETVALYRTHGVNPFSGCLPLLIQLPFLFGMFDLLKSTFELRGAPFIPGWIDNLTAPDVVFSWGYPLPFFGTSFHLLPFLLGAVMYYQQKMNSAKPSKGGQLSDQQRQQKFMGNMMTILFTVMFYHFPSGLNLYWLSSMLLGVAQQAWMIKKMNKPTIEIMK